MPSLKYLTAGPTTRSSRHPSITTRCLRKGWDEMKLRTHFVSLIRTDIYLRFVPMLRLRWRVLPRHCCRIINDPCACHTPLTCFDSDPIHAPSGVAKACNSAVNLLACQDQKATWRCWQSQLKCWSDSGFRENFASHSTT